MTAVALLVTTTLLLRSGRREHVTPHRPDGQDILRELPISLNTHAHLAPACADGLVGGRKVHHATHQMW